MRTSSCLVLSCLLALSAGCDPGPAPVDAPILDSAAAVDGGDPGTDGGPSMVDGGPSAVDGGPSVVDGGPSVVDGGPSVVDGGPSVVDGGPSVVDGGPSVVDGGPSPSDAGPAPSPEAVCASLCGRLAECLGMPGLVAECVTNCTTDLLDCSATELVALDRCAAESCEPTMMPAIAVCVMAQSCVGAMPAGM